MDEKIQINDIEFIGGGASCSRVLRTNSGEEFIIKNVVLSGTFSTAKSTKTKFLMEKLISRSYEAIKKRGKITKDTTVREFLEKISQEWFEAVEANNYANEERYVEEITDIATVCIMQVEHLGYDFINEFAKVILKNEKRANEEKDKIHTLV